jgi:outer membrane lipoprotein-sorting protein
MKQLLTAILMILLFAMVSFGQELTGEDIIQKVNDTMNVDTSYAKAKMTIVTTSGSKRTFVQESWSKDKGEKNMIRYLEPRRVKDQAVLMLNNADDIWMFFPRTQRVRKLATHAKKQKMQGSDFSYEDMGSGDAFIEDYVSKRLEDEKSEGYDCYKLELTRKPESDLSYSRLIIWVIKENFVPIAIDYYDDKDPSRRVKRLVQSDIRVIDDIPPLDDNMFTERALKK